MSLVKKVAKNISYLLIARTAFRFLTAFALIWAARYFGSERFGMYETAAAWGNTFLALNDLGMSTLIVREASRDEKKMAVYFGNTLLVEVVLSLLLFGVVMGIGWLGYARGLDGYTSTTLFLMGILTSAGLVYEFRKVMRGIFRVKLKLKGVAMLEILNGAIYLAMAVIIFLTMEAGDSALIQFSNARLFVNLAMVIVLFVMAIRYVKPKIDTSQLLPMLKQSYVFTLYNMFFMLYFQIDQILLSFMTDRATVGIYSAPAKIVNVLLFVPLMVFQVTMPVFWKHTHSNREKYKKMNNMLWRYLSAVGIPAGVGMSFLAPEIIQLVFSTKEYGASIPVLMIMGWFLAFRFFGIGQGNSLTTTDRQGLRAAIQVASIGVNIVLDIILIQKYGALGAGIATFITEAVIISCYFGFSASHLNESLFANMRGVFPIFLSTAGMIGVIHLIRDQFHVTVLVIIGAAVYLAFLYLFRFFQESDRAVLKQLTSR